MNGGLQYIKKLPFAEDCVKALCDYDDPDAWTKYANRLVELGWYDKEFFTGSEPIESTNSVGDVSEGSESQETAQDTVVNESNKELNKGKEPGESSEAAEGNGKSEEGNGKSEEGNGKSEEGGDKTEGSANQIPASETVSNLKGELLKPYIE